MQSETVNRPEVNKRKTPTENRLDWVGRVEYTCEWMNRQMGGWMKSQGNYAFKVLMVDAGGWRDVYTDRQTDRRTDR